MLNYHVLKVEITRQMSAKDLRFNVESLDEAEDCREEAAAFIADRFMMEYQRGEEKEAVAAWILESSGEGDISNIFVKIDYPAIINFRLAEWIGEETTPELVESLLFAFAKDENLFEIFSERVVKIRAEHRAEREQEEKENV